MPYTVPFLSKQALAESAQQWLIQYHPTLEAPVEIEDIMELQLGIDPFPMPNFEYAFGIVGTLGARFDTLYIDNDVYNRQKPRYRFTAAHEIGHLILHHDILDDLSTKWNESPTKNVEEWIALYHSLHPVIDRMEFQANYWAGHVLVPNPIFVESANRALLEYEAWCEEERLQGRDPDDSYFSVISAVCGRLQRIFLVSREVIQIRFEEERLIEPDVV